MKKRGPGRPKNPTCPVCNIKAKTNEVQDWLRLDPADTRENYHCPKHRSTVTKTKPVPEDTEKSTSSPDSPPCSEN